MEAFWSSVHHHDMYTRKGLQCSDWSSQEHLSDLEFDAWSSQIYDLKLKKSTRPLYAKACGNYSCYSLQASWVSMYEVRFGDFLDRREKILFLIKCPKVAVPPQMSSFLMICISGSFFSLPIASMVRKRLLQQQQGTAAKLWCRSELMRCAFITRLPGFGNLPAWRIFWVDRAVFCRRRRKGIKSLR